MLRISYWVYPILAGLVWLGTLLGLLLYWIIDTDRMKYPSMSENQRIAYISDVGAYRMKPLFVAGCVVTTILLDISFLADRWLRHKGRLLPNISVSEKILSGLTIVFAIVGTVGLILLSIFDTNRNPREHNIFLLLFIAGYLLSAIFVCWEYQRLGIRYRDHRILSTSFWIKLIFVIVELLLAIAFVATTFTRRYNVGAVLEWIIAFIFSCYVFSFYVDLYPAVRTKNMADLVTGKHVTPRYNHPDDTATNSASGSGTVTTTADGYGRELEEGRIEGGGEHYPMRDRLPTTEPNGLRHGDARAMGHSRNF